jgi:hypothetical protein
VSKRRGQKQIRQLVEFNPAMVARELEVRRGYSPVIRGVCKECGRPFNYFFGPQDWWAAWVKDHTNNTTTELFLEVQNAGLCARCNPAGHARLLAAVKFSTKKEKPLRQMFAQEEKQVQESMCQLPQARAV